jgi:tetratricopeptide (TPR) repeat protein
MGPEGDEEAALVRGLFAECLHEVGRLDAAMAEYRRALEFWETEEPQYAVPRQRAHFQLGLILRELGRTVEAEQEYERVLALFDTNAPDNATRMRAREELAELRGE